MLQKLNRIGHLSHSSLREVADRGLSAMKRLQNIKEKGQEQMGELVGALEVGASAYAFGFARGYWAKPGQDVAVMGVPIDLAGGLLGHLVGLFGGMGRYKRDCHNLANGALASYATTLGLQQGVNTAQKHPPSQLLSSSPATQGYGYGGNGDLSSVLHRASY